MKHRLCVSSETTLSPVILHLSSFIILQNAPKYHFLHFNPNSEVGNEIEKTCREPSVVDNMRTGS